MIDGSKPGQELPEDVEVSNVPLALRDLDQWVCWRSYDRNGTPTKKPVDPASNRYASATDSETWTSFETACEFAATSADGIGFVFTAEDPFVGVDLDDCRDPQSGESDDTSRTIINTLDSYAEVSPSGTGYHVLVRGELPDGRNRHGSVEIYDDAHFFTVTGRHVDGTPTKITERTDAIRMVHATHVGTVDGESTTPKDKTEMAIQESDSGEQSTLPAGSSPSSGHDIGDSELLSRAKSAENGEKFERLWRGDTSDYPSQSEADMALCCLLAFWTGRDGQRVDRLFRESGLMRPKWDEQHFADGSTYGEKTVERAVRVTDDVYEPESTGRTERFKSGSSATPRSSTPEQSESIQAATHPSDATDEQPDASRVRFLAEENDLLKDRLEELTEAVAHRDERIRELEQELRDLEERAEAADSQDKAGLQHPAEEEVEKTSESGAEVGVVSRLRRAIRFWK